MFQSRIKLAAALFAFGALIISPAMAGGKNGGGESGGGHSKNGGCSGNCGGGGGFESRVVCIVILATMVERSSCMTFPSRSQRAKTQG